MAAGKFDKRVTIETKSTARQIDGSLIPTWSTAAKRWAMIEDQTGRELYRAQQTNAQISAIITLRSSYDTLAIDDRISYGSRVFWIKAILGADDRDTKRKQILHVTEIINA